MCLEVYLLIWNPKAWILFEQVLMANFLDLRTTSLVIQALEITLLKANCLRERKLKTRFLMLSEKKLKVAIIFKDLVFFTQ